MRRRVLLLCLALLPAAAVADADPPLPAAAESARLHGDFKIIRLAPNAKPDPEIKCAGWKVTKEDVRHFFQKAESVTGEDFHALYYVLPCRYTGKLELAGTTYDYVINGGSHGYLITTSEPVIWRRFGCPRGCERIFQTFEFFRPDGENP
jgi:hypothetical protein